MLPDKVRAIGDRSMFPAGAAQILRQHFEHHAYPSAPQKKALADKTVHRVSFRFRFFWASALGIGSSAYLHQGCTMKQINMWFINKRRRSHPCDVSELCAPHDVNASRKSSLAHGYTARDDEPVQSELSSFDGAILDGHSQADHIDHVLELDSPAEPTYEFHDWSSTSHHSAATTPELPQSPELASSAEPHGHAWENLIPGSPTEQAHQENADAFRANSPPRVPAILMLHAGDGAQDCAHPSSTWRYLPSYLIPDTGSLGPSQLLSF